MGRRHDKWLDQPTFSVFFLSAGGPLGKLLGVCRDACCGMHTKDTRAFFILTREVFRIFRAAENYLVLSGRDAQQNELLVKRYLR